MEPQGRAVVLQQLQQPDVEDACITASSGRSSSIHQMEQDLQLARKKLAAKKKPSANMASLYDVTHSEILLYAWSALLTTQYSTVELSTIKVNFKQLLFTAIFPNGLVSNYLDLHLSILTV